MRFVVTLAPLKPTSSCVAKAPTRLNGKFFTPSSPNSLKTAMVAATPRRLSKALPIIMPFFSLTWNLVAGTTGWPTVIPKSLITSSLEVAPTSSFKSVKATGLAFSSAVMKWMGLLVATAGT